MEIQSQAMSEYTAFLDKLRPILDELKCCKFMDINTVRKTVESLEVELLRADKAMTPSTDDFTYSTAKQMEHMIHHLGRTLGLVLFATRKIILIDKREEMEDLRKEMMGARFVSSRPNSYSELDIDYYEYPEIEPMETTTDQEESEGEINLDIDDIVLQLKYGADDEFGRALSGFNSLIRDNSITNDWINEEGIVQILFNRLGSSMLVNRLTVLQTLRLLIAHSSQNKEKMTDNGSMGILVKSLARDVEERREAVGLMLSLSDMAAFGRRVGRIQGCIVMLAAILNGDDSVASNDAEKLLNALSNNTQNAIHMAEASYFKPLVHYLHNGSDMSKILMATALSRMELTDQCKASLGEDGAIEPLVKMFNGGKLEAKFSALSALQKLSSLKENINRLIASGMVTSLLQLLFSVTSVLMTLREPASAILAKIAQSESVLVSQDIAQQMLSLLHLSSPIIQLHLLEALNSIAAHPNASKVRRKMKENGAIQLLFTFLNETNTNIRTSALNLICTLSQHFPEELTEQQPNESELRLIVNIIDSSVSVTEKEAAIGILSNIPLTNKKATHTLKKAQLLPMIISIVNNSTSSNNSRLLAERIAGLLIRFTSDKQLQKFSVEIGIIPSLVKLLSNEWSVITQSRSATALSQLSETSLSLKKSKSKRWICVQPSSNTLCSVHESYCSVKGTFCLIKAGAVSPLMRILEGNEREADEAVLGALATLLEDGIWEKGSSCVVKAVLPIIRVLEKGTTVKAQEKGVWILERIFRIEAYRLEYGESAEMVLIDMAQRGDPSLKPIVARILAQLQLLQIQSTYF
ncbi:U-box domain-containing protein 44-like [Impatiens glandulifera]|uniref:U-box domain-containing protein 44-like n=1 Tax=Impatiens glandulifera TaxID=253017 RepID=UPI001FB158FA|nr:U-box domain-containing protein 44-like [Impatiens glandulifera]